MKIKIIINRNTKIEMCHINCYINRKTRSKAKWQSNEEEEAEVEER